MKRSAIVRRTPLRRLTPLRAKPKRINRNEPGRDAWKELKRGRCQCGCDRFSMHLHHHHVYPERLVRDAGGDPWSARNGMYLSEHCHMNHHAAFRKIPLASVPQDAIDFTVGLIGEDRALLFFARAYGHPRSERTAA